MQLSAMKNFESSWETRSKKRHKPPPNTNQHPHKARITGNWRLSVLSLLALTLMLATQCK
jgi:hypothetical protein